MKTCVLAGDMGGTFIKSACMLPGGSIAGKLNMVPSHSGEGPTEVLDAWEETLRLLLDVAKKEDLTVTGIGISVPGPFDYAKKISLMTHKFQAICGIDLEAAIRTRVDLPEVPFCFIQDSNAYLLGEQRFGAAKGADTCAAVTLGTGLGFSVMVGGVFLTNGHGACYLALYRQPWKDGVIEDVVSSRGIIRSYQKASGTGENLSAKEVGRRAREGDASAIQVMEDFGGALGRSIAFHLSYTRTKVLVVGGQISKDFPLFEKALLETLQKDGYQGQVFPAKYPEDAALYGAAAAL
jgi:glucokinase